MTAHRCLFADGPVSGKTVLVAGGAGAVGHFAIQLGRWAGARVITTVSGPEKAELARQAGAEHVVNYRDPDAAEPDQGGGAERWTGWWRSRSARTWPWTWPWPTRIP